MQAVQQQYTEEPIIEPLHVVFAPLEDGNADMKLWLDVKKDGVLIGGWKIIPTVFPLEVCS